MLACGSGAPGDPSATVTAVRISPDSAVIHAGQGLTYTVSTTNSQGAELQSNVTWQVVDPGIAQAAGGLARSKPVTALKPGWTTIIASVDGVSDTALVEVLNAV